MKYLPLAILLVATLTAASTSIKVEELLQQAKNYYHLSEDVNQLKEVVEITSSSTVQDQKEHIQQLEEQSDSIIQSILFAKINQNSTQQTSVNSTNSTSNYTYPTNTYYNYSTTGSSLNNSGQSNYTNSSYPTNYTSNSSYPSNYSQTNYSYPASYSYNNYSSNYTNSSSQNTSYPNSTYNYTYSSQQQPTYYVYNNQSNSSNTTNTTNTTYPNATYNYTYKTYQQPQTTNSYTYSNSSNQSNTTNNTNATYPNSTYNYTYKAQQPITTNYYTYNNQSNQSNTTNTTNTTYPNSTYNYTYRTQQQPQAYSSYSNSSNQSNTTNNTNSTNTTYPNSTYNYTYGRSSQPQTANYYTYSNSSNQSNTTNNTNSTNTTYPNSTYNYTYGTYQQSQTVNYYPYSNSSNQSNTTNNTNATYSNSTYNYTQSQVNSTRQRVQHSKINLKLRQQLNLSGSQFNYNHTQNVTFYNQSSQRYDTIVLFNETQTVSRNTSNQYYYYQNATLITLTRDYDYFGNVIYRCVELNYTLVLNANSTNSPNQMTKNQQIFGTIVQGNNNVNASYYDQGSGYTNINTADKMIYGHSSNYNYGNANLSNQSGTVNNNKNDFTYNAFTSSNTKQNGSITYSGEAYNISQTNNNSAMSAQYDLNQTSLNHQYTNTSNYAEVQGQNQKWSGDNFTYSHYDSIQRSFGNEESSNETKDNGQYQKQQSTNQENNLGYQSQNAMQSNNYTLSNSTSNSENYQTNIEQSLNNNQDYQGYQSSEQDYSSNIVHSNSASISNSTNGYNVTDQSSNNYQGHTNSQLYINGTNEIQQSRYHTQENTVNQTHIEQITANDTITSVVNIDGTQQNSTSNYNGEGRPETETTQANIHESYTETQQFNSLRGSKRATGSWKQLEIEELLNSNSQVAEQAISAVQEKFNPQSEGFEFKQILSVHEQIVSGVNYQIKLLYNNAEEDSRIYQVIIYSVPWSNKPDQIVSCQRLAEYDD